MSLKDGWEDKFDPAAQAKHVIPPRVVYFSLQDFCCCLHFSIFCLVKIQQPTMSSRDNGRKRPAPGANGGYQQNKGKPSFSGKPAQKGDYRPTKPQPSWAKSKAPASKPAPKEKQEATIKRKRPVTQGGGEEEDVDMDSPSDDEEMEGDQAEGEGHSGEEPPEKRPKMSKAERAALHAAQPHRTALLPSHPLLHGTLLPLWETARKSDLGKEERKAAVAELWEAVKGRVGEVSRGHKGGRVLQTVGCPCFGLATANFRLSSTEAKRRDWASRWSCSHNGVK